MLAIMLIGFLLWTVGPIAASAQCSLCRDVKPALVADCSRTCATLSSAEAWMLKQCVGFVNSPGSGIDRVSDCVSDYRASKIPDDPGFSGLVAPVLATWKQVVDYATDGPVCDHGTINVISSPTFEYASDVGRVGSVFFCNGTLDNMTCPDSIPASGCRVVYDPPRPEVDSFHCYQPTESGLCVAYSAGCAIIGYGGAYQVGSKRYFATARHVSKAADYFSCNLGGRSFYVHTDRVNRRGTDFVSAVLAWAIGGYAVATDVEIDSHTTLTKCTLHTVTNGVYHECTVVREGAVSPDGTVRVYPTNCPQLVMGMSGSPCFSDGVIRGVYSAYSVLYGYRLATSLASPVPATGTPALEHGQLVQEW